MVAKRSLAASSISRLAAPNACRRNTALITTMPPRTSAVRAGERLRASPRAGVTYCLTDWYELGLAPSKLRPLEKTCGNLGTARENLNTGNYVAKNLTPVAVEIDRGSEYVVKLLLCPTAAHPPPWRRRVGHRGWRRVNESKLLTPPVRAAFYKHTMLIARSKMRDDRRSLCR